MLRMMTYGKSTDENSANARLRLPHDSYSLLIPDDYCICRKTGEQRGADTTPFTDPNSQFYNWTMNRLVPVKAILKIFKIQFVGPDGVFETRYIAEGRPIGTLPQHPNNPGFEPNGWNPNVTADTIPTGDQTYTAQYKLSIVYHTISFTDPGNNTWTTVTFNVLHENSIPSPSTNPEKPDTQEHSYLFTGWVDSEDSSINYKNGMKATKDITFVAVYNQESIPNNNVKTMDNMGQIYNSGKDTPVNLADYAPTSGHWWSGPHDGHSADVAGNDGGISPNGSSTGRRLVVKDGVTYTHYDGDSIVYEFLTDIGALEKLNSAVVGTDLTDNWTGYDSAGNAVLNIKSNTPWIKFVVLKVQNYYPSIVFKDQSGVNTDVTVHNVHVVVMVEYYIADNDNSTARAGSIKVTTSGGDCSYIANEWAPNNKYMTDGDVFFYQLGLNYIPA